MPGTSVRQLDKKLQRARRVKVAHVAHQNASGKVEGYMGPGYGSESRQANLRTESMSIEAMIARNLHRICMKIAALPGSPAATQQTACRPLLTVLRALRALPRRGEAACRLPGGLE